MLSYHIIYSLLCTIALGPVAAQSFPAFLLVSELGVETTLASFIALVRTILTSVIALVETNNTSLLY